MPISLTKVYEVLLSLLSWSRSYVNKMNQKYCSLSINFGHLFYFVHHTNYKYLFLN